MSDLDMTVGSDVTQALPVVRKIGMMDLKDALAKGIIPTHMIFLRSSSLPPSWFVPVGWDGDGLSTVKNLTVRDRCRNLAGLVQNGRLSKCENRTWRRRAGT
jgi:hypothetical protein